MSTLSTTTLMRLFQKILPLARKAVLTPQSNIKAVASCSFRVTSLRGSSTRITRSGMMREISMTKSSPFLVPPLTIKPNSTLMNHSLN